MYQRYEKYRILNYKWVQINSSLEQLNARKIGEIVKSLFPVPAYNYIKNQETRSVNKISKQDQATRSGNKIRKQDRYQYCCIIFMDKSPRNNCDKPSGPGLPGFLKNGPYIIKSSSLITCKPQTLARNIFTLQDQIYMCIFYTCLSSGALSYILKQRKKW